MAATEAQKRAATKYQRDKCKTVTIRFSQTESDLYEWLRAQPNQAGYVKSLIRKSMEGGSE